MRARCSAFIATSLDGFICRPDGSIDWLDRANIVISPGEDCGYQTFMQSIDAIVLGRHTFEQVLSFDAWPYAQVPVYVLSRTLGALPAATPPSVRLCAGSPQEIAALAHANGHRRLYVDGGETIRNFIAAKLLAEITITVIPILLGSGRPLFGATEGDIDLQHRSTTAYPFGFVQSTYAFTGQE